MEKTEEEEDWIERAEGLIDMGNLELEERSAVENFGELCRQSDFLSFFNEPQLLGTKLENPKNFLGPKNLSMIPEYPSTYPDTEQRSENTVTTNDSYNDPHSRPGTIDSRNQPDM